MVDSWWRSSRPLGRYELLAWFVNASSKVFGSCLEVDQDLDPGLIYVGIGTFSVERSCHRNQRISMHHQAINSVVDEVMLVGNRND